MDSYEPQGSILGYNTRLTYDPNGNIERLIRKGSTGSIMDDISYEYYGAGNQLESAASLRYLSLYFHIYYSIVIKYFQTLMTF